MSKKNKKKNQSRPSGRRDGTGNNPESKSSPSSERPSGRRNAAASGASTKKQNAIATSQKETPVVRVQEIESKVEDLKIKKAEESKTPIKVVSKPEPENSSLSEELDLLDDLNEATYIEDKEDIVLSNPQVIEQSVMKTQEVKKPAEVKKPPETKKPVETKPAEVKKPPETKKPESNTTSPKAKPLAFFSEFDLVSRTKELKALTPQGNPKEFGDYSFDSIRISAIPRMSPVDRILRAQVSKGDKTLNSHKIKRDTYQYGLFFDAICMLMGDEFRIQSYQGIHINTAGAKHYIRVIDTIYLIGDSAYFVLGVFTPERKIENFLLINTDIILY